MYNISTYSVQGASFWILQKQLNYSGISLSSPLYQYPAVICIAILSISISCAYLELLLLCEAFHALPCGVAHKGHHSHHRLEPGEQFSDFLHAVPEGREDHHAGIHGCAITCHSICFISKRKKSFLTTN